MFTTITFHQQTQWCKCMLSSTTPNNFQSKFPQRSARNSLGEFISQKGWTTNNVASTWKLQYTLVFQGCNKLRRLIKYLSSRFSCNSTDAYHCYFRIKEMNLQRKKFEYAFIYSIFKLRNSKKFFVISAVLFKQGNL